VQVEARADCPADRREPAAGEVRTAVKQSIGVSVDVAVVDPETLPRSVGKLKRLTDERAKA
jgi:phenylacetate-CoA ligase